MYKSVVFGKGGIFAKVVADSISEDGIRITTMELNYHRYIHGEVMTHRMFSRNAASSRAIPVRKMIEQVKLNPATPIHWGKNQSGMQAFEELASGASSWESAGEGATMFAEDMMEMGYHKQITNRLLEPFQFMKAVVTATEWSNFFDLRIHKDAQPEIQELAKCIKQAQDESTPDLLGCYGWHVPYVDMNDFVNEDDTINVSDLVKCSVARCARVSYLTHDKALPSTEDDLRLYKMLCVRPYDDGNGHILGEDAPLHLSPLEHQAMPMLQANELGNVGWWRHDDNYGNNGITHSDKRLNLWSGNFRGWIQNRQLIV